jgi:hypothetical protein
MDDTEHAPEIVCDRCERSMAAGSSHYWMTLTLRSGFDGWLPLPDEEESTTSLINACDNLDADELEAQVNQELEFTLCPACRNHIALDPLNQATTTGSKTLQ